MQKFNSKGEYQSQFGTFGTGAGQLKLPKGIAVDKEDNLYVITGNPVRVKKFNSKGEYQSEFGPTSMGTPTGITVDPSGNIWVLGEEHSLAKFNSKGEFLGQFGKEGTGDGQLASEVRNGIASDSSGNIWVSDTANRRIEKFNSKGEFVAKFGSNGAGDGQFKWGLGIAIDPNGSLWVTDSANDRVQQIFPEGEYVSKFGSEGAGEGQFKEATYDAADAEGRVWVVDSVNKRVQVWKQTPYPVGTDAASAVNRTEATLNATINPGGVATSYQFEYSTTTAYGKSAPASPKSIGSGSTPVKASEALNGLRYNTTYYYHVVATTASGATYGETRHFTTLPGPGAEAKWRIGGKTFAELGLSEESVESTGSITMEFPTFPMTFKCSENGPATLKSAAPSAVQMTLTCEAVGAPTCKPSPVTLNVDSKFSSIYANLMVLKSTGCGILSETANIVNGTGAFDFGTEGTKLNVTAVHTTAFGLNPLYITGSIYWALSGKNAGKTLGVW